MQIQVQIKTRVDDFLAVRKKIEEIADFVSEEDKIDYYFQGSFKFDRTELRLRKKKEEKKVTLKINYFDKNIEKNEEYAFCVDNASDFIALLENVGIKVAAMKHKKSYFFDCKGIQVQLVNVKELGYFLEIEKKCNEKEKEQTKMEIMDLSQKLGLDPTLIEQKNYFELLIEKRKKGGI
ncbi:MAG: class IV adenylate cyclase [Nanoarchaeota archaeon]